MNFLPVGTYVKVVDSLSGQPQFGTTIDLPDLIPAEGATATGNFILLENGSVIWRKPTFYYPVENKEEAGIDALENMLFEVLLEQALIDTSDRPAMQKAAKHLASKGK